MSNRFKISSLIMFLAFAIVIATGVHAGEEWTRTDRPGEQKFNETYTLDSGAKLRVELQDADVELIQGDKGKAHVEVYVVSRSSDRADEYFEESNFRAEVKDNTLSVGTRMPRHRHWNWTGRDNGHMRVVVTIPAGTAADVHTNDGDVRAETYEGDLRIRTSDGDVRVESAKGSRIELITSDGDVISRDLTADDMELSTSDGDLRIDRIVTKVAALSTSDGDIKVDHAGGETIALKTSDGDIRVTAAADKLSAHTSDGDITVAIEGNTALNLRTYDGNVRIEAPGKLAADLDLRGEPVILRGSIDIDGEVSRNYVRGTLHGGGSSIVVRTSDGSISLDLQ